MQGLPSAKILIIGQAPGLKVHKTGIPFNDPSGDRLRDWLNLTRDQFYDENKIALMPMSLCFPGRNKEGADLPPVKGCADFWHPQLLPFFPKVRTTLLIGQYAIKYYLKEFSKSSLTETAYAFEEYLPSFFPLPHPSWRNLRWFKRNPFFESTILPRLRETIALIYS
jgi:uracil-DNA glycosylase family 4